MTYIPLLNASNSSMVFTYGSYTDFNIWVLLFICGILFMIFSRVVSKDVFGRIICGVVSIIFLLTAMWSSLSLAHLGYAVGATSEMINQTNGTTYLLTETTKYNYIYPSQQVIGAGWITIICAIFLIISIINLVDIILLIIDNIKSEERRMATKPKNYI